MGCHQAPSKPSKCLTSNTVAQSSRPIAASRNQRLTSNVRRRVNYPADPPSLESALLQSVGSSSLAEVRTDLSEAILDQAFEDGILKDIPVFGSIAKLHKTFGSVRDLIFTKKVAHFLLALSKVPEPKRVEFLRSVAARGEDRKVGETLLVLVERLDHYDRAELLAKVFAAFVNERLSMDEFRRLARVVEQLPPGSMGSLRAFYSPCHQGIETGGEFLTQFAGLGLVTIEFYPMVGQSDIGGGYEKTDLGKMYLSIIDDA